MRWLKPAVLTVLAALFVVPAAADAQNLVQRYELTPKAGAQAEFEQALQQHAQWREENGDPWGWDVYEVVQGKHLGTFYVVSAGHTWADFDAYEEGFDQQAGPRFAENVGPLLHTNSSAVEETMTDLTRWPENSSEYRLISVDTYGLDREHAGGFFELLEKEHEAMAEQDYPQYQAVIDVLNGKDDPKFHVLTLYKNWADFATPEQSMGELMEEAYGEDEVDDLVEQFRKAISSHRNVVLRYRPDLSVEGQQ